MATTISATAETQENRGGESYRDFYEIPCVKKELSLVQENWHGIFKDVDASSQYDKCIKNSQMGITEAVNSLL